MSYPPGTPPPPPPPNPRPPGGPGRLYSVAEVAELWNVSDQFVYNAISRGELARVDIGHGKAKTRIAEAELVRYINDHTRRATKGRAA